MTMTDSSRQVFVVHGRNEMLRQSMFAFLRALGLSPIEWDQAVAMTGKGSPFIGEILHAAFERARAVVVLITPDEIAYLQTRYASHEGDPETQPAPQARPNVLFEAGMAMGRNEDRTILVEVGQVREFSDVAGRHAVRLTNDVADRQRLAKRLETAGCAVDTSGVDWHKTGDFTTPSLPGNGLPIGRRVPSDTSARKPIDFDLKYMKQGDNKLDKLEIVNRGIESALDIRLKLPERSSFSFLNTADSDIAKIPGGGKSITIYVWNTMNSFGKSDRDTAFDVTLTAHTESGDEFSQDVWVDTNR